MKAALRRLRQRFMHACPQTYTRLSIMACRHVFFRTERNALRRGSLPSDSEQTSVLFFGGVRAGSMLVGGMLRDLCAEQGLPHIDWVRYFVHTDRSQLALMQDPGWTKTHLPTKGYYFGALREGLTVDLANYRVLIMVRHPLDVCVSHYFAVRDAHTLIDRESIARRELAQSVSIDEYARHIIDEISDQYEAFLAHSPGPTVCLSKYEDMAADFPRWLEETCRHLGLAPAGEVYDRLLEEIRFTAKQSDTFAHQRSGQSRQYLRHLSPEVISGIARSHGDLFERLGYEVEVPSS